MSYIIKESSPKAAVLAKEGQQRTNKSVYPFDDLNVGMSFVIPLEEANCASLRAIASRKAKDTSKKFIVVKHDDLIPPVVEVARVE